MKILITGGNGYIANSLYNKLSNQYNISKITRNDFDLTNPKLTSAWFDGKYFDVVIHTAISGGSRLKEDTSSIIDQNLNMIFNLQQNSKNFNKLISFGSGAEIFQQNTPYDISKLAISSIIENTNNWYNLRIFGVFDADELNTRFIKGNILRYINYEPMIIHADKIMDFIFMDDLVKIVKYYIENENTTKTINCCYSRKYTLKNIADIINTLDNHKVPVIIKNSKELEFYCGISHELPIDQIGLECGIINTFKQLLKQKALYNDSSDNK